MRFALILGLILISSTVHTQETFQSDSLYKARKVKTIKLYAGTNKMLNSISYYDREGRLIKYYLETNGWKTITTSYLYNDNGFLNQEIDTIRYFKVDQKVIKHARKKRLTPHQIYCNQDISSIEISNHKLFYENNQLIKNIVYAPV